MIEHDPASKRVLHLLFALCVVAIILGAVSRSASAQTPCNPNTQVCSTTTTRIAQQTYEGEAGSARISFYPVPKEKGNRKGVSVWVFGFGPPLAAADCLDKANGSGTYAVTHQDVPYPVRLGFDHYTVEFCDPTDYLQRNAFVVKELIQEISPTLGSTEKFVIAGSSMGGLITRYVLTRLESEGFDHGVDLWITNDAPHKGAYIPLSVQSSAS